MDKYQDFVNGKLSADDVVTLQIFNKRLRDVEMKAERNQRVRVKWHLPKFFRGADFSSSNNISTYIVAYVSLSTLQNDE